MGNLLASDFIAAGDTIFGNPDTTIFTPTAKLSWVNESYINDIAACFPLPEITQAVSQTISASTGYFGPVDFTSYIRINNVVRVEDSFVMIPMSQEDYARLGGNLSTPVTGSPDRWYLEYVDGTGVCLKAYPKPAVDCPVIIQVNRRPADLTASDATTLQAIWDEPLKGFFISRYAQMLRNYDDARYWRDYAQSIVARLAPFDVYGSKMMRTLPSPVGFGNMGGQVHEA